VGKIKMDGNNQEDWLDRQLQEAAPYIEDNGFTAQVLEKLPAPRRQHRSLRTIILLGSSALASAVAYALSDGGRFVVIGMSKLAMVPTVWLFAVAFASGILVMTGGIFAAMSKTSQLQS
jgi:hypothetical protein